MNKRCSNFYYAVHCVDLEKSAIPEIAATVDDGYHAAMELSVAGFHQYSLHDFFHDGLGSFIFPAGLFPVSIECYLRNCH